MSSCYLSGDAKELKLPKDIAAYGARALQPMVSIMNELSVGSQTDRHLVAGCSNACLVGAHMMEPCAM